MNKSRKVIILVFVITAIILFVISYCDNQVQIASEGKLYSNLEKIPPNHTGILLGTGKFLAGGYLNPYYKYRIDAAVHVVGFASPIFSYVAIPIFIGELSFCLWLLIKGIDNSEVFDPNE